MPKSYTATVTTSYSGADAREFRDLLAVARDALFSECMTPDTPTRDLPRAILQMRNTIREIADVDAATLPAYTLPDDADDTRRMLVAVRDRVSDLLRSGEVPARETAALARRVSQLQAAITAHDSRARSAEWAREELDIKATGDVPFNPSGMAVFNGVPVVVMPRDAPFDPSAI